MQIAVQSLLFILGVTMLFVEMKYKFAIFVFAAICLRDVNVPFIPFGHASYFLSNCFILSCLPHFWRHVSVVRQSVLYGLFFLTAIATIFLVIFSPHYQTLFQWLRLIEFEFIGSTLVATMAFLCVKDETDLLPTLKWAIIALLILTAIGAVNYITKSSFWVNTFVSTMFGEGETGARYMYSERFRVQAMFHNPFDYGFISVVMACFFFYTWKKKMLPTGWFWLLEACCLFGTYTCGCRTVHVMFLVAVIVFALSAFEMRQWLFGALIALLLAVIILPSLPAFEKYMEIFEKALNTDMRTSEGGSSLAMRALQFNTVLYYIRDHMIFGRGAGFFEIDLGWADRSAGYQAVNRDLYGLEGAYLSRLLERGIFGFAVYLIFYGTLFVSAFKKRMTDRLTYGLFASVIAAYFFFAQATGELSSVYPTMLMLGATLKLLYVKAGICEEYAEQEDTQPTADPSPSEPSPTPLLSHDLQHSDSGLQA